MQKTIGYAAHNHNSPLVPFSFERRDLTPTDVQIEILFCGVCHSDIHQVRNEWGSSVFPMVPGHEIVGKVTKVGNEVTGLNSEIPLVWVAWSIPAGHARIATIIWSNFVTMQCLLITVPISIPAVQTTVAIPDRSSSTRILCYMFRINWIRRP